MTMSRFLFATFAGGGNLPPALGIARALSGRGHEVGFLGHREQEEAVRAQGLAFCTYRRGVPWPSGESLSGREGAGRRMSVFADRGIGDDLVELAAREAAELVVVDHLLWGAHAAAANHDLPFATLVHTLFGQQRESWTRGPGAAVARGLGYEPVQLWLRARVVVVATLPELDPASGEGLPENVVYTGPVWQGQPRPAMPEPTPLVLVSLSTVAEDGQADVLQRILDALAGLPVRVVATTGPNIDPDLLQPPPNAEVLRYLPHEAVMPRASAVVSHGGHATAMAALAYDLPLLLMPIFPLGDQPEMARLLDEQGAAMTMSRDDDAGQIRGAVERLLGEPAYRRSAARLGALIRRRDGAETAADVLTGGLR
jgi:UDP:flavonoid glycosyltransferase YjiC (YdhE family)